MVDSLAAQSSICTSCSSFPVYQLACTKVARSSLCLFSAAFAGAERHKRRVMIPYGLFSIYFEPYACFKDCLTPRHSWLIIQHTMHQGTARPNKAQINRLLLVQEHRRHEREIIQIQQISYTFVCVRVSLASHQWRRAGKSAYDLAIEPSAR